MAGPGTHDQPDEAMLDLLIKQVTEGLSPEEQRTLDVLDSAVASDYLNDLERAAAAISLVGTAPVQPPAALRSRLEQSAERHFASQRGLAPTETSSLGTASAPAASSAPGAGDAATRGAAPAASRRGPASRSGSWGWLAAAACLLLAIFGWLRTVPLSAPPVADVPVPVTPVVPPPRVPVVPPTPAQEREALLASAESVKVTLGGTKDPASKGVTGDVVWDPLTQKGFLHFAGLAPNDPKVTQYQLWIFDGERDPKYPVDGGVFDVPGDSAEVVIPIHATLPIRAAKAFAVTIEKPGGVVVSGLAHVVLLGKAG